MRGAVSVGNAGDLRRARRLACALSPLHPFQALDICSQNRRFYVDSVKGSWVCQTAMYSLAE